MDPIDIVFNQAGQINIAIITSQKKEIIIYDPVEFLKGNPNEVAYEEDYAANYLKFKAKFVSGRWTMTAIKVNPPNNDYLQFVVNRTDSSGKPSQSLPEIEFILVKDYPTSKEILVLAIGVDDVRIQRESRVGTSAFLIDNENGLIIKYENSGLKLFYKPR